MIAPGIGESQGRILRHLKRHGPSTIQEMATALGLGVETVRAHLRSLGGEHLVERRGRRSSGPGRPEILYGLTETAEERFPSQDGKVLRNLALFLESRGQGQLVRAFFDDQVKRRRAAIRERLEGLGADRTEEVARILSEEGFMAEVVTDPEGNRVLRLGHCPLRNLVAVTRAPCQAELRFIREMLGNRLVRISYIPSGDRACCYALQETG